MLYVDCSTLFYTCMSDNFLSRQTVKFSEYKVVSDRFIEKDITIGIELQVSITDLHKKLKLDFCNTYETLQTAQKRQHFHQVKICKKNMFSLLH